MGSVMWHKLILIFVFCLTYIGYSTKAADPFLTQLNGMHKAVVNETYDASVIPWRGPEAGPVVVNSSFHLQNIVSLEEKEQILTSKMFLMLQWRDPRLQWNPMEHQGVEYIRLPPHMLWKPDIVIENSATTSLYLIDLDPYSLLGAYHDGMVSWTPYVFSKTFCSVDATFFPFDEQRCDFILSSWTYPNTILTIKPVARDLNISAPVSTEWDVKTIKSTIGTTYEVDGTEGTEGLYFNCQYSVVMSRKMNFSNLVMLVPCVILTVLTLLMFLLPAHTGHRMDLGLAIWTSLVLFLLIVNDAIPESSEGRLPILGTYLILMLLLVSLSIMLVIINTLGQRKLSTGSSHAKEAVSKRLDKLSFSVQIVAFLVIALFAVIYYTS